MARQTACAPSRGGEDGFDRARSAGLIAEDRARRVRAAGPDAVAPIGGWGAPYSDGWEDWRPDPRRRVTELPGDWNRTPAATSA
ncbi:hypothetical protein [Streptomyces pacificus]|uniref:hypothetical protein n=1 Tax=Streptomyces pacificus TaxID=2705029 RepID=UPI00353149C5